MGWDMKNKFLKKIFILLAVLSSCFLFASFSPSLDGRAVVVNEGEMPSGLFAKTVGYLPGDTIIVSNVDGTSSVEILVIGSLDASEGVAIMLSPEAASAIGIDKKDNNIVKITKRSDKDERCTGTAVIAKSAEIENEVVDDEKIEETSPENEILPPVEETFTENVQTEESAETEEVLQPTEEAFVEDIPTEETFTEEEVLPETEETLAEKTPTEEKSDSEEYEAIVLIPIEPEENISSEEKSEEEIVIENLKDETEKSDIKIVESEKKVEKESVIEKYKVESLDELEKGSYYIQIVVLKEESNIQKIVDEYGNNYPITIVPLKNKSAYQVLIGPISMDEYGTVLNRFKSYGYKDAFLRKIK